MAQWIHSTKQLIKEAFFCIILFSCLAAQPMRVSSALIYNVNIIFTDTGMRRTSSLNNILNLEEQGVIQGKHLIYNKLFIMFKIVQRPPLFA